MQLEVGEAEASPSGSGPKVVMLGFLVLGHRFEVVILSRR